MDDPAVSVVVVNFNAGPMLAACLRASGRETLPVQRIVVDNASDDDSVESVAASADLGDVEILRNERNVGFARAVNAGVLRARAPLVLVLNPDCIAFPGAIGVLAETMGRRSRAAVAGGLVVNPDGTEQRGCRRRDPTPGRIVRRMMYPVARRFGATDNGVDLAGTALPAEAVEVDAVSGAFLMLRRDVFEDLGGFDEDYFLHFEDLDLCRRVRRSGRDVLFEPAALAVHLKSASGGVSARTVAGHKRDGLIRYLDKFHQDGMSRPVRVVVRAMASAHLASASLARPARAGRGAHPREPADDPRRALTAVEEFLGAGPGQWTVVTGATSAVGRFLVDGLANRTCKVLAITRGTRAGRLEGNAWWVRPQFLAIAANARVREIRAWLHVAPIWVLEEFHDTALALGPRRIIAVSSTSIDTKGASASATERCTVASLEAGERCARELAARCDAPLTIFRPSMIYGTAANRNVEVIRRWIRLFRFFPLVGTGRGRRQPVHAADVASACIAVLDRRATFGKLYQLAGAEVIEFKDMIGRVFEAESMSPRFVRVPAGVLKAALAGLGRIPGLRFLTPAMVDRVEQDLVFDIAPARADFDYAPRRFEPAPRHRS